jgi:hypothetical protein
MESDSRLRTRSRTFHVIVAHDCWAVPTALNKINCDVAATRARWSQLMGHPDAWIVTGGPRVRAQSVHCVLDRAGQGCWARMELGGGWIGGWAGSDGMDDGISLRRVRGQWCACREVGPALD